MSKIGNWTFPVPPSLNRSYKCFRNRVVKSAEARKYQELIGETLADMKPTSKEVSLIVDVYRPRKSGDLDNYLKIFLDSLSGFVYTDDKLIKRIVASRWDDKLNPRVELEVSLYEGP